MLGFFINANLNGSEDVLKIQICVMVLVKEITLICKKQFQILIDYTKKKKKRIKFVHEILVRETSK